MRFLRMLRMRTRALVRSDAADRDLDDQIREHLQHLIDDNLARGMTPAAAEEAARREFGPVMPIVEAARDARGVSWFANLLVDLRYGARLARRAPAFSTAAILTITLGIGAATAIFSVVYGVLLHPLPYGEPERLVNIWTTAHKRGLVRAYVGMANVYDWRARNTSFEDIAAVRAVGNFNLAGQGGWEPERLFAARVSANLFPVLRVAPFLGRAFTEEEDEIGRENVAILTYGLWKRRFGGDPAIVGATISLSGTPFTVVGVMGPEFAFPSREYQIYTPLTFDPRELVHRQNYSYLAIGRLKAGVSLERAQAEMTAIASQLAVEHPRENDGIGTEVVPMLTDTVASVRTPLYILLGAVFAMLTIGCANLANLLLARALARQRELSVRAALGAGRGRLISQSVSELAPIILAGGALGLAIASAAVAALVPLLPPDVPRVENIALNLPVLIFATVVLVCIAAFLGAWPALEASRRGLAASVSDGSRGATSGRRGARLRDSLVVVQIAATLWLVVGAGLLMRSFVALTAVNPGFNAEGVYSLHLAIPRSKYPKDLDVAAFCRRVLDRVEAIPGVASAAMVNRLPLAGGAQTAAVEFEGITLSADTVLQVDLRSVTPDYFRTLQIPVLSGRGFTEHDAADAPLVGVIDERHANSILRGINPIGRRFRVPIPGQPWIEIVGVVGHIRHDRVDDDGRPQVYFPYHQRAQDRMALVVRGDADAVALALAPAIVAAIRSVDPEQPVYDARPLGEVVGRSLAQRRLQTTVLAAFAAIALALASIGVYGVIAYSVGQRRREFGIRLALGAHRREIVTLVMRRGAVLSAAGAAIGLAAAAATGRALGSLLYNVGRFDPASFAIATVVLLTVALVACALPARRAAAVDPALTLRAE